MVVAINLHGRRSPGRRLLEERAKKKREARLAEEAGWPAVGLGPGSLLRELEDLAKLAEESEDVNARLYSARRSLLDPPNEEEELAWHGTRLIWSKGTAIYRSFTFDRYQQAGEITQALFAWFTPSNVSEAPVASTSNASSASSADKDRLFGTFSTPSPPPWTDEQRFGKRSSRVPANAPERPLRALCVFLRELLFVHFCKTGQDYYLHLPFKFRRAWALSTGLLVERRTEVGELAADSPLATLYSLSDPLDEFRIVSCVASCTGPNVPDHQSLATPMASPAEQVLHVSRGHNEPPLLITFDSYSSRLHIYAYVLKAENESRREGARMKAAFSLEAEMHRGSKGKEKASNPSMPPPSSPNGGQAERVRPRKSVPETLIGKRIREDRRVSAFRGSDAAIDRMVIGGEHERDTTMIRQASAGDTMSQGQMMRSEMFVTRLGEAHLEPSLLDPTTSLDGQLDVVLFDCRKPTCLLAAHYKRHNRLHILWLDEERPGLVARTSEPISAVSIAPVLSTRPDIYDLLILDPGSAMSILTLDSYSLSIDPLQHGGNALLPKSLMLACEDCVTLDFGNGQEELETRISLRQVSRSPVVRQCLVALSCVTSASSFVRILTCVLDHREASIANPSEWSSFAHALSALLGVPDSITEKSAFAVLRAERIPDIAFAARDAPQLEEFVRTAEAPISLSSAEKQAIIVALHMVAEDLKLTSARAAEYALVLPLLARLVATYGLAEWLDYYRRAGVVDAVPQGDKTLSLPYLPFDILRHLSDVLANRAMSVFPDLRRLASGARSRFYGKADPTALSRSLLQLFVLFRTATGTRSHAIVKAMHDLEWKSEDVNALALGIRAPLLEALRQAQLNPPPDWPVDAYILTEREDMARVVAAAEGKTLPKSHAGWLPEVVSRNRSVLVRRGLDASSPAQDEDASASLKTLLNENSLTNKPQISAHQFSQDLRLEEVSRMLQTWKQVTIRMPDRPDIGEHAMATEHTTLALHLASRTLSLPVGAAMFTFRTEKRRPAEPFRVTSITLTAKVLPQGNTITPDNAAIPPDKRVWADFHAGVGAALRLAAEAGEIDFSDIAFNKPDNLDAKFAGLLMGLGLTGHIRSMASYQAFAYLDPKHELTSIGLLLGLAASFVSTCDPKVTSVLGVHLSAMHPSDSTSLNVSQATQAAGMISLGLLYLGTNRRRFADICIRELANTRVVPLEGPEACREAYTLSLGFAFGFIMLGAGKNMKEPLAVKTLRLLGNLITGQNMHELPSTKNSMSDAVDVALTSPAATVALALVYLDSNRSDVAEMLVIPTATEHFDYVRPDLILLRTLARALIMRASICPTKAWIESLVPDFILKAKLMGRAGRAGSVDIDLAYWCIVAGGLMAMALRYAGTADGEVHATMIAYFDGVRRFGQLKDPTVQGRFLRRGIRSCSNVIVMALATVMAGTGELNVLRRLRVLHGQIGEQWEYGSHLATHMSLGLLFLGGGAFTLNPSPAATAVLLCALYPALPSHSGDNRGHVQAARHLWVLAVEPRRLIARDVDTNETAFLPVRVRVHEGGSLRSQKLVAPTLIPELSTIESIRVDSPRYLSLRLSLEHDVAHLRSFLRSRTIYVKRSGGYLSYAQDPKGIRSLFSRSKAEAGSHVFDFGKTAEMLNVQQGDHNDSGKTALEDSIEPFASDTFSRGMVKYLCRPDGPASASLEAFLSSTVIECLSYDKPSAFSLYLGMRLAFRTASAGILDTLAYQQLDMAYDFYAKGWLSECLLRSPKDTVSKEVLPQELIGPALLGHLFILLRPKLTSDSRPTVLNYLKTGTWPTDGRGKSELARFLTASGAPNVNAIGQLTHTIARAKAAGERAEDFELVLRVVLEKLSGQPPNELLFTAMRESWL